jgi:hypothetical protein
LGLLGLGEQGVEVGQLVRLGEGLLGLEGEGLRELGVVLLGVFEGR